MLHDVGYNNVLVFVPQYCLTAWKGLW